MRQAVIIGDMNRWGLEANAIGEMLQLAATGVVALNIGRRQAAADLNSQELSRLFPGKPMTECIHLALTQLYSQGIITGILALVGNEPYLYELINRAFATLPFGQPKIAVLAGDCTWPKRKDVVSFYLPGTEYSLNPVVKTILGNAAFALGGIALCSAKNFSSPHSTIGVLGTMPSLSRPLTEAGFNYIFFKKDDHFLTALLDGRAVQGLVTTGDIRGYRPFLQAAANRGLPIVIACSNPLTAVEQLMFLPANHPITIVSAGRPGTVPQISSDSSRRFRSTPYIYGGDRFCRFLVEILTALIG